MKKQVKVSVIIPLYNEEQVIIKCLESLIKQSIQTEIVVIDDGSTDNSHFVVHNWQKNNKINNLLLLKQSHQGPGAARNLGAKSASGEILVYVDADMTFSPEFIRVLTQPIIAEKTKGTFSQEEYVANWSNVWARCWNYNQNISDNHRLPKNYPSFAPIFRAILTSEFHRVRGYTVGWGWTDDWSLSQKLGYQATTTKAECFHTNPSSLKEVFIQASWIGKNQFFTENLGKIFFNLIRHSWPLSLLIGVYKSIKYKIVNFLIFKIIHDFGISWGLYQSILGKSKNK